MKKIMPKKTQRIFFVSSDQLQNPLDALILSDEIRKLHPDTANN